MEDATDYSHYPGCGKTAAESSEQEATCLVSFLMNRPNTNLDVICYLQGALWCREKREFLLRFVDELSRADDVYVLPVLEFLLCHPQPLDKEATSRALVMNLIAISQLSTSIERFTAML
ncbi:unnamed protein product [Acanthoscelides obtectus]|uniref:Uncharacterized protein n=1 Tax=Acanthoscelides obtectus TaxID=200917 RepID=A0A9P0JT83_ACAOB|nr:unnamed protein product [Acanthoscelides obtectus]CAK1625426.1 hypothetical protein AOBTE_LOCUS3161 [Acanthoscelides obtectus]